MTGATPRHLALSRLFKNKTEEGLEALLSCVLAGKLFLGAVTDATSVLQWPSFRQQAGLLAADYT